MNGTVLDRIPAPPCAALLGWRLLSHDAVKGWVKVGFDGKRAFLNPAGIIQGGFLAAMLDDCMGPAAWLKTGGTAMPLTMAMTVSYLAPARPGPQIGEGWVVQLGRSTAHLGASLADAEGTMVAQAAATCRLVPASQAVGSYAG
jgi:uncharacterized protein (TIGR00369 family)